MEMYAHKCQTVPAPDNLDADHGHAPGSYEEARHRAVQDELDKWSVNEGINKDISQLKRYLDVITGSAAVYAKSIEADLSGCDWQKTSAAEIMRDGASLVSDLRTAVSAYWREDADYRGISVWQHVEDASQKCRANWYLNRPEIEQLIGRYIALPYRSNVVDRLLVDLLIFMEMNALWCDTFGKYDGLKSNKLGIAILKINNDAMMNSIAESKLDPKKHFKNISSSVIGQSLWGIGVVYLFVESNYINGQFLIMKNYVIPAYLAVCFYGIAGVIYSLVQKRDLTKRKVAAETALLPLSTCIEKIGEVYADLKTDGPISVRHIVQKVDSAAESQGVVWPPPLYALLDDIQSRSIHF